MGHLSHIVIFNLIVTGLSSTYNDIGQITLRWLILSRTKYMGHLSHWVIFNLIATDLSSTYNDIGQITLRWLIKMIWCFKCIWTTRSKYGSSIAYSNFQLDRNWFKFHLILDTMRWLIKRWFQRNVRIQNLKWTTVVWVRASVLFNKSSMRWLL